MDIQLKKGLLDICVLKVLEKGSSYGYEIIKTLMGIIEISESTLYPILKRLELSDCLSTYKEEHNGRLRKYYQITDIGIKKIDQFKIEWSDIKKIYNFILEGKIYE